MDNIIVSIIMIALIAFFVGGAVYATRKGNSGFTSAVKYDERLTKKDKETEKKEEHI